MDVTAVPPIHEELKLFESTGVGTKMFATDATADQTNWAFGMNMVGQPIFRSEFLKDHVFTSRQ